MNIPQSSITPFGYCGIPTITISGDHIMKTLEAFFDVVIRTGHGDFTHSAEIFRSVAEKLVVKMGAEVGVADLLDADYDPNGKMIFANIRVMYIMPDGNGYTKRYILK